MKSKEIQSDILPKSFFGYRKTETLEYISRLEQEVENATSRYEKLVENYQTLLDMTERVRLRTKDDYKEMEDLLEENRRLKKENRELNLKLRILETENK